VLAAQGQGGFADLGGEGVAEPLGRAIVGSHGIRASLAESLTEVSDGTG
jgi:hypothetical protein